MEKVKILQIVPSLSLSNGVAAYLMNYYKTMNLESFETTILVLNDDEKDRYDVFKELGCKIVEIYKNESWPKYLKRIDTFFKENHFDIVHCHTPNYGAFYMHYAKKYKVKARILHSHSNKSADGVIKAIRNTILFKVALKNSNKYLACSKDAGDFLFGNKEYLIINNAIECNKFKFDQNKREEIRKELDIEDKYVIGQFGRIDSSKNQLFTLEVFKEFLNEKKEAKLLLIGNGVFEEKIKEKIREYKLDNNVIMVNSKDNIYDYYNCLDVFILPSKFEGLGMVLIEAQTNSLPCYTSKNRVPELVKVTPLLKFIELEKGAKYWADFIINDTENNRKDYFEDISKSVFNIENEARKLEEFYKKCE